LIGAAPVLLTFNDWLSAVPTWTFWNTIVCGVLSWPTPVGTTVSMIVSVIGDSGATKPLPFTSAALNTSVSVCCPVLVVCGAT
jgi:hypothetical protein